MSIDILTPLFALLHNTSVWRGAFNIKQIVCGSQLLRWKNDKLQDLECGFLVCERDCVRESVCLNNRRKRVCSSTIRCVYGLRRDIVAFSIAKGQHCERIGWNLCIFSIGSVWNNRVFDLGVFDWAFWSAAIRT